MGKETGERWSSSVLYDYSDDDYKIKVLMGIMTVMVMMVTTMMMVIMMTIHQILTFCIHSVAISKS